MYRLLRFAWPYEIYVRQLYDAHPQLANRNFETQVETLQNDFFSGAGNALTMALRPLGYDTRDYAINIEPMQRAWAREQGVRVSDSWMLDIARAQILRFQPDILMVNPYSVPREWLREIKTDVPSIRLVVARHSAPRSDLSAFKECGVVLTGDVRQVAELEAAGITGVHHHHGFDARLLDVLSRQKEQRPVVLFTGQLRGGVGFHQYRTEVVTALARAGIDLDIRLLVPGGVRAALSRFAQRVRGEGVAVDAQIRRMAGPPVFGLEMYRAMSSSAVVLNVHGDVSRTDANNLRLWEATGIGTCLLTDSKPNLSSLFDVGSEVLAFDSPQDAVEKSLWALSNPEAREKIAAAGQQRTLRDHTYEQRAKEFDQIIRRSLE